MSVKIDGNTLLFDIVAVFVIVLIGAVVVAPVIEYLIPEISDKIKLGIIVIFCVVCVIYYQYEANYYSSKMEKKP
jgi:hypothetical protein